MEGSVAVPKARGTSAVVLAQPVPNQWPWCGGTAQSRGLCAGTNCALKTVPLPGRGVLNIWYLVFSGVFRDFRHYRMSVNPLLPLSLVHAWSIEVISSWDTKLCSWTSRDSYILVFQDNGFHLIPEKEFGLFLSATFYPDRKESPGLMFPFISCWHHHENCLACVCSQTGPAWRLTQVSSGSMQPICLLLSKSLWKGGAKSSSDLVWVGDLSRAPLAYNSSAFHTLAVSTECVIRYLIT